MDKLFILCSLIIIGAACQNNSAYQEEQLIGSWNSVAWNDKTNDKPIGVEVDFNFDADGQYIGNYGNQSEKGKYWISGDNLHTIEEGKAEKKVKIEKLTNDTLIFGMNRAGNLEEMILVRAAE